jgi:hypothetical protein
MRSSSFKTSEDGGSSARGTATTQTRCGGGSKSGGRVCDQRTGAPRRHIKLLYDGQVDISGMVCVIDLVGRGRGVERAGPAPPCGQDSIDELSRRRARQREAPAVCDTRKRAARARQRGRVLRILRCHVPDHRDGNLLRLQNDPKLVSRYRAHSVCSFPSDAAEPQGTRYRPRSGTRPRRTRSHRARSR